MNSSIHRDEERRGITKKEENKSAIEVIESEDEDVEMGGESESEIEELPDAPHAPIHPSLVSDNLILNDPNENGATFDENNSTFDENGRDTEEHGTSHNQQDLDEETTDSISITPSSLHNLNHNSARNVALGTSGTVPASPSNSLTGQNIGVGSRRYEGCSQISNYIIEKTIGSGTFGEVSLGRDKRNGTRVALKRILIHNQKEGV